MREKLPPLFPFGRVRYSFPPREHSNRSRVQSAVRRVSGHWRTSGFRVRGYSTRRTLSIGASEPISSDRKVPTTLAITTLKEGLKHAQGTVLHLGLLEAR